MTTIAFAHLDLCSGPEARNLDKLAAAMDAAAAAGAQWLVTPEMAVQGYFFWNEDTRPDIPVQPSPALRPLVERATAHGLGLFLGCGERDPATGAAHNACLVFGRDGALLGRHRKTKSIGPAEAWTTPSPVVTPIVCPGFTAGILVCADAWTTDPALAHREQGAEVIVVCAAWPPGPHGPNGCWERGSLASGLPYWVCNQTGPHPRLDFRSARSSVIVRGEARLSHSGADEAVLLFEWDFARAETASRNFETIRLPDTTCV